MKPYIIFYIIAGFILSLGITYGVLALLSLVNIRGIEDCNSETCFPEGCVFRGCSNGECISSDIGGCCIDGICNSTLSDTNYTLDVMYVNNIQPLYFSEVNESDIINLSGINVSDGVILNGCLISTGECINEISSTQVQIAYSDNLNSYGTNDEYISIGDGYLNVYQNGSIEFLKGIMTIDTVKSTNEVCLINIESLLENGTISINNLTIANDEVLNITDLIVSGNLFINNVANLLNFNFNDTVQVSGVLIVNNTVQGYLDDTYSDLLINPHGGNVGIAVSGDNINANSMVYPLEVNGNIELGDLVLTSNSSSTSAMDYYEKYELETYFNGPWDDISTLQSIFIYRIASIVQMTFSITYLDFCNGTQTYIESTEVIPERFINNSTVIEQPIRVVDDSQNVLGSIIINETGYFQVRTLTTLGYFEGEAGNYCGFEANTVVWML